MSAFEWLALPLGRLVTLALLHFLWQGLAICLILVAVVELSKIQKSTVRYACSLAALLAIATCPLATIAWLVLKNSAGPATSPAEFLPVHLAAVPFLGTPWLETLQPVVLAAWLLGVTVFAGRLIAGAVGISRLRRSRVPLPPKLAEIVARIGARLQFEANSLVFLSKQAADAMVLGLVRPLVLIPASWATEMPPALLEAAIAHELAHLVRCDLWVNLLQRLVETLLFYHPAVWWLSRRLRIERELCADELAVDATGDAVAYAQALEHIASLRASDIRPALAAFLRGETDMRILHRVRNVLGQTAEERSHLWPAGVLALALPLGLWAAASLSGSAIADDDDKDRKKPAIKRERNDDEVEIVLLKKKIGDEPKREEFVEERIIKRDGKPIIEVQLGRKDLREDSGDRRVDELAALVKKLTAQVEQLQDEVSQLRASDKRQLAADRHEMLRRSRQEATEREEEVARAREREAEVRVRRRDEEARKRAVEQDREIELQARDRAEKDETIQRAIAEKQKAIAELAARKAGEAAERVKKEIKQKLELEKKETADAAGEKAELTKEKVRKALEEKIRQLKEDGKLDEQDVDVIKRKLIDEKALITIPGDKKPVIKESKEPR